MPSADSGFGSGDPGQGALTRVPAVSLSSGLGRGWAPAGEQGHVPPRGLQLPPPTRGAVPLGVAWRGVRPAGLSPRALGSQSRSGGAGALLGPARRVHGGLTRNPTAVLLVSLGAPWREGEAFFQCLRSKFTLPFLGDSWSFAHFQLGLSNWVVLFLTGS